MAIKYICDGCGKEEPGFQIEGGEIIKPYLWFGRRDENGEHHACCRDCIEKIAAKTGTTPLVAPF